MDTRTETLNATPRIRERPAPRPGISLHLVDYDGVLFDADRQRLYAANTTATFIWCCLDEGLAPEEIVQRLEDAFHIDGRVATGYVSAALASWHDLGLLDSSTREPLGVPPADFAREALAGSPSPSIVEGGFVAERIYRLLDIDFRLRLTSSELLDEISTVLSPLTAGPEPAPLQVTLDILRRPDGYLVLRDGHSYRSCARDDQLVPLIKTSLVEVALAGSGDFGAVHAAGVGRNGRCILLPGVSGSGKSTLTAALVASGLELLGDDTVVLDAADLVARPVPFGICVKDGAWELLAAKFPDLGTRPIHNRLDGKRVRYLVSAQAGGWASPSARFRVQAIAFIRRLPEGEAELTPISKSEALSRLTAEFCLLGETMSRDTVEKLVDWISHVSCFELRYSDLDRAAALIGEALA